DNANSYAAWATSGGKTKAGASNTSNYSWTNQNILSYVKEFNRDHRINATAVFEQTYDNNFTNKSYATDLVSTIIGGDNTALGAKMEASSLRTKVTMMSWMGRVNYVFKNRYMMTASWRYDGSSRLAKDNRCEHFPSIALAWNMKEESYLQSVDFLSQLKLRVGYGETGNQSVPIYAAYTEYEAKRTATNELALVTKRVGTPDLKWERTNQWNGGVDLGFFNNRLTASVDVYHKLSKDVLLEVNAPMYTGFSSRLGNAAHILNKGFEITIGADPIAGRNFTWNTNVTLSKNVGTIERLDGDKEYAVLGGQYENGYFRNIKGKKIATMWGYVSDGLWQKDQLEQAPAGTEAGSYKFKDLDGKAGISVDDMTEIGNGQPTFQWGWNNTLNYKNFDLGLFIIGVHGFDIYNYTREARLMGLSPNPEWKNRWRGGNENTTIPGFVKSTNAKTPSSQFVEKGDFVKVKSITLGYTLPQSVLQKAKINNLRVYASVQNPFVFTGYSGLDPEVTLKSPLTSGIDWGYYPNGRNF
ncbi:MAG: SusC/RagA family TonB-linked outer membrane protein, partial [Bacteroidales bacterium]